MTKAKERKKLPVMGYETQVQELRTMLGFLDMFKLQVDQRKSVFRALAAQAAAGAGDARIATLEFPDGAGATFRWPCLTQGSTATVSHSRKRR